VLLTEKVCYSSLFGALTRLTLPRRGCSKIYGCFDGFLLPILSITPLAL
jgi:hypothetical protein